MTTPGASARRGWPLGRILIDHAVLATACLISFTSVVFLYSSHTGRSALIFLAASCWLVALPIIVIRWRSVSHSCWVVPIVWGPVFAIVTLALPMESSSSESTRPLPGTGCALRSAPSQNGHKRAVGPPHDRLLIAFDSDRSGNPQIYVMNRDGSGQRRLTRNATTDTEPAWSPDGTLIAFTRRCWHSSDKYDTDTEVYVMNADGTGQHNLTRARLSNEKSPAWSPDGTKIAFVSNRGGGALPGLAIFSMNADGSVPRRLTRNDGEYPSWSPDGRWIAFDSDRDHNFEIYRMAADGSRQQRLTRNPAYDYDPTWSPDGGTIAFTSERNASDEIYIIRPDGSGERRLTHGGGEAAAWLPDGVKVSFEVCSSCGDGHGGDDFYTVNADGRGRTRLTHTSAGNLSWQPTLRRR